MNYGGLVQVLSQLESTVDSNLLVGIDTGDDAAVYRLSEETALVLTVDFFPPIVDDPYQYGAISAANSLSDIYAMGATPLLALNIVGFPIDAPRDVLGLILQGGQNKAKEANCIIVGGHTVDDPEPKYGLAVFGVVRPGSHVTNSGARPGDNLILTKPIGTGMITSANRQNTVGADIIENAIINMMALNKDASAAMTEVGVNAATDITGFGLIGHLATMAKASGITARINFSRIPLLPGAQEIAESGVVTGGGTRNLIDTASMVSWEQDITESSKLLLCDPQTSGGLLISVESKKVDRLLNRLEAMGLSGYANIGEIVEQEEFPVEVTQ